MLIQINTPNNLTDGLRNFVAMIHNAIERGDTEEAKSIAVDLYNDIGSAYVCEEKEPEDTVPVPEYNEATDGDYNHWLVANNID